MSSCAVPNCNNNKKNCDKSFFKLPKDKKVADAWIGRLRREDELPKEVIVCEVHFTEDCFDPSTELRRRFQQPGKQIFCRVYV